MSHYAHIWINSNRSVDYVLPKVPLDQQIHPNSLPDARQKEQRGIEETVFEERNKQQRSNTNWRVRGSNNPMDMLQNHCTSSAPRHPNISENRGVVGTEMYFSAIDTIQCDVI